MPQGARAMPKGQQKSNRETKKPKATKNTKDAKAAATTTQPVPRPEPSKK